MNKNELVKNIASKTKLSQKNSKLALDALSNIIKLSLKRGEPVKITNFGKFDVRYRQSRVTINPKTKKKMIIPACRVPSFKALKELKTAVGE